MTKEEKQNQARMILEAFRTSTSNGTWLNSSGQLLKAQRGVTPMENIMKAIRLDRDGSQKPDVATEKEMTPFAERLTEFESKVKEHLAPIERSDNGADYDVKRGVILIPEREEYDRLTEYAHDLYTAASLATGIPDRFNRHGVDVDIETPEGRIEATREQLVGELVSAAMCIEEGQAASLAPSSVDTIEEWEKYIADNPEHFDGIMDDVNHIVYALRAVKRDRTPDYDKIQGKKQQEVPEQTSARQEQVKLKSQSEQKAAERQVSMLVAALAGANDKRGIWMNATGKLYPSFYPKGPSISPFNAIMLTLHADQNGYRSNLYTTFQEAKTRNEGVKASEKGVPFNWYNWSKYVNRNNPEDIITRKDYLALTAEDKTMYKGVHNREIRTLFNLDQTMTPVVDPEHYGKALGWNGGEAERNPSPAEDKILRSTVSEFVDSMNKNLVSIESNSSSPVASYDMRHDLIRVPSEESYANYHDYVHDLVAQVVRATGHPERLAREGAVNQKGQDALIREELVVELSTGVTMLGLGMPARLSSQSMQLVDDWNRMLKEDPQMIDIIETDVNNALEVMNKAERGEKVEYSSFVNQQKVRVLQDQQKPQVSASEGLILADIILHHGMDVRDGNFNSMEEKAQFLDKFSMGYYLEQMQHDQELAKNEDPDIIEAAYSDMYNHAANIDQIARELRPAEWNIKGRREVEESIHDALDANPKDMVIIMDEKTRKADIILPQGAFTGGKAILPNGQERNFYLSPDEVLCPDEKKDVKIQYGDVSGFNKVRIDHALANDKRFEPSFTRYFNRDGVGGFHADDRYFEDKRMFVASLNKWSLSNVREQDIRDLVAQSRNPNFDRIMMLKDDDGRWMLYIQAQDEQPFGVYPDKADVNKFFTASHQGNAAITAAVRQELGAKYYEMAKVKPSLQVNILGEKASEEDAARLQRVNIFKNKNGQFMIVAKVTDTPKDMPPREITPAQWQRLWLSPDHNEYKRDLAAKIFADLLHPERYQEQKEEAVMEHKEEKPVEVKEEPKAEQEKPKEAELSPVFKQYSTLKAKHPDAILLFRNNDFYTTYQEDAQKTSSILGITLTRNSRIKDAEGKPIFEADFPYHALDTFLPRLIRAGQRVAICDQIESPRQQEVNNEPKEEAQEQEHASRGFRR